MRKLWRSECLFLYNFPDQDKAIIEKIKKLYRLIGSAATPESLEEGSVGPERGEEAASLEKGEEGGTSLKRWTLLLQSEESSL